MSLLKVLTLLYHQKPDMAPGLSRTTFWLYISKSEVLHLIILFDNLISLSMHLSKMLISCIKEGWGANENIIYRTGHRTALEMSLLIYIYFNAICDIIKII